MSKDTLAVLGAGVLSGWLFIAAVTETPGAMLLAYVSQLPLFMAGLGMGLVASVLAGTAGLITTGLIGGGPGALGFVLANAAPALLITRQALLSRTAPDGSVDWYPPGLLVTWLLGLGTVFFLGAMVYFSGSEGGLQGYAEATMRELITRMAASPDTAAVATFAKTAAPYLPGIVIASWLMMVVVNATLAQGLLARFGRNRRPGPDITTLHLPQWMPLALAGVWLLAWLGEGTLGFMGRNLAIILVVPFFLEGLGVIHALLRHRAGAIALLIGLYLVLLFFGWPVILVAGLGLIDHWAGFRRGRGDDSGKEEG